LSKNKEAAPPQPSPKGRGRKSPLYGRGFGGGCLKAPSFGGGWGRLFKSPLFCRGLGEAEV